MAKGTGTVYECTNCGATSVRWFGRCPRCNEGTLAEKRTPNEGVPGFGSRRQRPEIVDLSSFKSLGDNDPGSLDEQRIGSGLIEVDRVLGGGFLPGEVTVLTGEPGAGKSTIASQIIAALAESGMSCAYVCGEESPAQVMARMQRLGLKDRAKNILAVPEAELSYVVSAIAAHDFVVIDSIQMVYARELDTLAGNTAQLKYTTNAIYRQAKESGCIVVLVAHVTKSGELAGPRHLEHMVDRVLMIEGDRTQSLRILRAPKNRFGSTDEVGLLEMTEKGLKDVLDPSQMLLEERPDAQAGSLLCPVLEGSRPLMVEVQALVVPSPLPTPIKRCRGIERARFDLLLALTNHQMPELGLAAKDVYLNVAGGLFVSGPSNRFSCCASYPKRS